MSIGNVVAFCNPTFADCVFGLYKERSSVLDCSDSSGTYTRLLREIGTRTMVKAGNSLNRSPTHLLHRAGQRASDLFAEEARSGNLTPRQFAVLSAVAEEEGLTQTSLVERTGIDRSTLADIVARLLDRGLIQRRRAKNDGRAYAIKLSTQGAKALRDAQPAASAADARLLAVLPAAKRNDFLDSLALIAEPADK